VRRIGLSRRPSSSPIPQRMGEVAGPAEGLTEGASRNHGGWGSPTPPRFRSLSSGRPAAGPGGRATPPAQCPLRARRTRSVLPVVFCLLIAPAAFAQPAPRTADPAVAAQLRDRALTDPLAYELVESLTTEVGPRLAGSPGARRATGWGVAKLKALGFTKVRAEPYTVTAWARGEESAEIVAPYPQKLAILGLGKSVPTPPEGIEAEAVVFPSLAEMLAAPEGSLTGKIAVVTQKMTRTQDGSGYGAAVRARGAVGEAAKRGAVAYLIRSVSTADDRMPHTGSLFYAEGDRRIPAAALSTSDADLLDNMARRNEPIRIRLTLRNTTTENAPAWNVVGEIRGRERPNEVIVIGGHLDAWDPGTGAHDDAAGIGITVAAAKLIGDLKRAPRRTIRVVMWGSEETGGAGQAYFEAHRAETASTVVAGESDLGGDRIWALRLPKGAAGAPQLNPLSSLLAPLKIFIHNQPAEFGGADTAELQQAGVPVFHFSQDASRYFDWHHSANDTLDKIDREQLNQNVAAWAAFLWLVADSDIDFRALAAAAK
jgi:Zn-dependent M28 family amino/carboxypeptidase